MLLSLAFAAAGCSDSTLEATGAAGGMYDAVGAAIAIYDVEGNRQARRDDAPVVTSAHLNRIKLDMSERQVSDIIGVPPSARTEGINGPAGFPLVRAQWINGDLSQARFQFLDGKLTGVSHTGIE